MLCVTIDARSIELETYWSARYVRKVSSPALQLNLENIKLLRKLSAGLRLVLTVVA